MRTVCKHTVSVRDELMKFIRLLLSSVRDSSLHLDCSVRLFGKRSIPHILLLEVPPSHHSKLGRLLFRCCASCPKCSQASKTPSALSSLSSMSRLTPRLHLWEAFLFHPQSPITSSSLHPSLPRWLRRISHPISLSRWRC